MKTGETRIYKTESDDFFPPNENAAPITGEYRYIKRGIYRPLSFFLYWIIAKPLTVLYTKLKFREKYIGREKLKPYRRSAYFMYLNHTQPIADAATPNTVVFGKKVYVVVNRDNLALPVIGPATPLLGALPLPDCLAAARNFNAAIEKRLSEGAAIAVYPEAHVWPYYTGIRPFSDTVLEPCMRAPGVPVFALTRVYKRRKRGSKPRCEIYVDGPFMPKGELPKREARRLLASEILEAMKKRAELSDIDLIIYKKEEDIKEE